MKKIIESWYGILLISVIPTIPFYLGLVNSLYKYISKMTTQQYISFAMPILVFVVCASILFIRKWILYINRIIIPYIKIIDAKYGTVGNSNPINVNPGIQSQIKNQNYKFKVTLNNLGLTEDPEPNNTKTLTVVYMLGFNGETKVVSANDNNDITLYP